MSESEPRPVGGRPPSPWRRRRRVGAAVVVALVAVGLWWYEPWNDHVEDGEVVGLQTSTLFSAADLAELDGVDGLLEIERTARVVVPSGVYEVQVGERVDALVEEAREGADDGTLHARRGSSFLPVTWAYGGPAPYVLAGDDPLGDRAAAAIGDGDPTLVVRVDGETVAGPYDLDQGDGGGQAAGDTVLGVTTSDDAVVEVVVTFDGVEQVLDTATGDLDAGLAAAYYEDPERGPREGPRCRWDADVPPDADPRDLGCAADAYASPWIPGSGWVEEAGQTWVQVAIDAGLTTALPRTGPTASLDDRYLVGGSLGRPLLGGTAPVAVDRASERNVEGLRVGTEVATWLLEEPPARVEITMTGSLRLDLVDASGYQRGRPRPLGLTLLARVHR